MGTEPLRVALLGELEVSYAGESLALFHRERLQSLLAYLLLHRDVPPSRQRLSVLLWPDSEESQARTNLRQLLHHLRGALPDSDRFLQVDSQCLSFRSDAPVSVDVAEFESAVARADEAEARSDRKALKRALEEAERCYRGDLLPALYDAWVEPLRESMRRAHRSVLERLADLLETEGEATEAIEYASRLTREDPLDEEGYRRLMRLHALSGDRASALRVYHQCASALDRELQVTPGAETEELRAQVMSSDLHPSAPSTRVDPLTDRAPLVGRDEEWSRLQAAWRRAGSGRASFVTIRGEAGIGKTRLAEELLSLVSREGGSFARTRCYAAEGRLAYAPVSEWLRNDAFRPVLAAIPAAQAVELSRILPELSLSRLDRLGELGRPDLPAPEPLSESWQRQRFFNILGRVFLRVRPPLCLLIDDLQWCDGETLEWLHYLLRLEPRAPLLVLGTARSEEAGADDPLTRWKRALQHAAPLDEIELGPLDAANTAVLASHLTEERVSASQAADLYRETEGNPLFVVETLRARRREGERRTNDLPPRVQAVVAARLAQLSPVARQIAGLSATIGRAFSFDLLARCSELDEDDLVGALDELWRHRIIREHGARDYDFAHDKLREVAYAELGPVRRRRLHERVARALATGTSPDPASPSAAIASHFEQAALIEESIPHRQRAAEDAQKLFAHRDAIQELRQALSGLETLAPRPARDERELALRVALGASLIATEGYGASEVGSNYARARALCDSLGRPPEFAALWGYWLFRTVRGELAAGLSLGETFLENALTSGESLDVVAGHFCLGCDYFHMGAFPLARQHFEQGAQLYRPEQHHARTGLFGLDPGVFHLSYLAHALWHLGFADRALETTREALSLAKALADPFSMAIALDYAAMHHQFRRETAAARERAEAAIALCRQHGFAYYLAWGRVLEGWTIAESGEDAEGLSRMNEGLRELRATGAELRLPYYLSLLARVHGRLGHSEEEQACLEEGLKIADESHDAWISAELHRQEGDRMVDRAPESAESHYRRALETARRQSARSLELRAASSLARLREREGRVEEAEHLLRSVYSTLPEGLDTVDAVEVRSYLEKLEAASRRN